LTIWLHIDGDAELTLHEGKFVLFTALSRMPRAGRK